MDDAEFDRALIATAFALAAEKGWRRVRIAAAARRADLPLDRARLRFPGRGSLLMRLGRMADQRALEGAVAEGSPRDRLFDMMMRRIDVLQAHRAGVLALLCALPAEPPTALLLAVATRRSMGWMLEAAGIPTTGALGRLRVQGLMAVWLWTLRAWRTDESEDLAHTMAALDAALSRAQQAAEWFGGTRPPPPASPESAPPASPPAFEPPPDSSPEPAA